MPGAIATCPTPSDLIGAAALLISASQVSFFLNPSYVVLTPSNTVSVFSIIDFVLSEPFHSCTTTLDTHS